jgi:hypothetical protein
MAIVLRITIAKEVSMSSIRLIPALVALALLSLTGCHPDWHLGGGSKDPVKTSPVPFETIDIGEYSGVQESGEKVVYNQEDWVALWNRVHAIQTPLPEVPAVDFSQYTVVAVFQGMKGSGGHSITVREIADNNKELEVTAREVVPPAECIVTEALTNPYHIVRIAKTPRSFIFHRNVDRVCNP